MMMFIKTCQALNLVSLVISIPTNILLQFIVYNASSVAFGSYTKLMYTSSINLTIFSILHTFLTPIISVQKNVIFVFSPMNPLNLGKDIIRVLIACYGASYCFSLVICALTFIFRYDRVCDGPFDFHKKPLKLMVWILGCLFISVCWALVIYFIAVPTPYIDGIIAGPLNVTYTTSLENVTYVAAVYQMWNSGIMEWNEMGIFLGVFCSSVIIGSIITIMVCFRLVMKKAQHLQSELFKAQCIQAFIPISLIFLPIFALLALPIFCVDGNIVFSLVNVFLAIFPVIDPIALIFSVSQYRNYLLSKPINPFEEEL
ncbi:CBN-STR-78 protein [Caenorhabditis brenneri]|uniref:CBN-STR-78 protein n=1 Tax=Caenorhabditis brenneri TaxID=135651 RepID=G0NQ57_CAEBE|nr:CBN-STR-78 protein [Caenorhabditis brenneri]